MDAILRSEILSQFKNVIHGSSTMLGGNPSPPFYNNLSRHVGDKEENILLNRNNFFGALGVNQSRLVHANQIHSANIAIVDEPGLIRQTDGYITQTKNIFLIISTADCYPILIYDNSNEIACALHAGWRGTQKKIAENAVSILAEKFGSNPAELAVFIGPGISKKNFEVGKDVSEMFDDKYVTRRDEKYFVDILADNVDQLVSSGVKKGNIEHSRLCTYEEKNYLHSYRRDREKSGRMFTVIGMK